MMETLNQISKKSPPSEFILEIVHPSQCRAGYAAKKRQRRTNWLFIFHNATHLKNRFGVMSATLAMRLTTGFKIIIARHIAKKDIFALYAVIAPMDHSI